MFNSRQTIQRTVKGLGIVWGVAIFAIGVVSSFTLNSVHIVESVIVLVCGFLAVLPLTIFAIWKPKVAAILLLACIGAAIGSVYATEGLRDAGTVGIKLGTPNLLFILSYLFLSSGNLEGQSSASLN